MELCRNLTKYTEIYQIVSMYHALLSQNQDNGKSVKDIKALLLVTFSRYVDGTPSELKEYEKLLRMLMRI